MKRKDFLSAIVPLGATLSAMATGRDFIDPDFTAIIPPYLQKGDTIGICCMAGFISLADIQPAVSKMKEWGFQIKLGNTIGEKDFSFGGTDAQRIQDLQQMMDDPSIKAIMSARGGYGTVRIIDGLDFKKFALNPKWIVGFSDVTVLHAHLNRNYGIASLHSKMCNSFPDDWNRAETIQKETIESINKCLTGEKMQYSAIPNLNNRTGSGEGALVGGNLNTIETLAGTKSDLITKGKILFVEDKDEYLYSVDRMFWNLKRTGKLSQLKGLIIGGFKLKPDDPGEEFGRTIEQIVLEKVKEYNYPVCFDFPVGHQKDNFALKYTVQHQLTVTNNSVSLTEIR
ncbi:MAG TPA: LD-carboxypeptidase [Ferruginibacter sp.]|nr:LD-carboxypeptidase [Ferruginibacter sp.]